MHTQKRKFFFQRDDFTVVRDRESCGVKVRMRENHFARASSQIRYWGVAALIKKVATFFDVFQFALFKNVMGRMKIFTKNLHKYASHVICFVLGNVTSRKCFMPSSLMPSAFQKRLIQFSAITSIYPSKIRSVA